MEFNKQFDAGDVIAIISWVMAIIGAIFAYIQWKKSIKTKQAEFLDELIRKLREDEKIIEVVYMIDYNDNWYNKDFHNGGDLEKKIDNYLSYLSYICYLNKVKMLTHKEFDFFKYELNRVIINQQVQAYLFNLYHFSKKNKAHMSFDYLFRYGKKYKFFCTEFFDSGSGFFPHYLNF